MHTIVEVYRCRGPEVDAELVGLVCALAFGHAAAWPDVQARAGRECLTASRRPT